MDADTFTVTGDTHQNSTMVMLLKVPLFNGDTRVSVQYLMCLQGTNTEYTRCSQQVCRVPRRTFLYI